MSSNEQKMKFGIFLCGEQNSGKTTTLKMVAEKLVNEENWIKKIIILQKSGWEKDKDSKGEYKRKLFEGTVEGTVKNHDYIYILEKDGKKILIYTCGDMPEAHKDAFNIAEKEEVDILVHAIRCKKNINIEYISETTNKFLSKFYKQEKLEQEEKHAKEIVEDIKLFIDVLKNK